MKSSLLVGMLAVAFLASNALAKEWLCYEKDGKHTVEIEYDSSATKTVERIKVFFDGEVEFDRKGTGVRSQKYDKEDSRFSGQEFPNKAYFAAADKDEKQKQTEAQQQQEQQFVKRHGGKVEFVRILVNANPEARAEKLVHNQRRAARLLVRGTKTHGADMNCYYKLKHQKHDEDRDQKQAQDQKTTDDSKYQQKQDKDQNELPKQQQED